MAYLRFLYKSSLRCVLQVARSVRLYEFLVQVWNIDVLNESSPSWASGRCWCLYGSPIKGHDPIQIIIIIIKQYLYVGIVVRSCQKRYQISGNSSKYFETRKLSYVSFIRYNSFPSILVVSDSLLAIQEILKN